MSPTFSIITISFNHAEFIEDTIRSVMNQGRNDIQHIIIDGGSTDGTQKILEKYPHLEWTSEPDRGICDALNKGFGKARGKILAWLNADDWYAPNALNAIDAEYRKLGCPEQALIMGEAVETDRSKNHVRVIKNAPRHAMDVARYWVPLAWLAQPSVFFTSRLLQSVKLANGNYFDDSFRYSMDADLWMRMGEHVSFDHVIPEVLSYFRVYGENKTGRTFAGPRKELGRAFRRLCSRRTEIEKEITVLLPLDSFSSQLIKTQETLIAQNFKDFDVLFLDYSGAASENRNLSEIVAEMEEHSTFGVKYIKSEKPTLVSALNTGLRAARSPIIGCLLPGVRLRADCFLNALNVYLHDPHGASLALGASLNQQLHFVNQKGVLDLTKLFQARDVYNLFFCRTIAAREVGGFAEGVFHDVAIKRLIVSLVCKGWGISVVNPAAVEPTSEMLQLSKRVTDEIRQILLPYEEAFYIVDSSRELKADPFFQFRASASRVVAFTEADLVRATDLLKNAPTEFMDERWMNDVVRTTQIYPKFGPGWFVLSKALAQSGQQTQADQAYRQFVELHNAQSAVAMI
ncbi:MAG: glycosyltransferase [Proteobacteria bacterium]|nr:glycosyltransferase [Pseudomonadota bacterium]